MTEVLDLAALAKFAAAAAGKLVVWYDQKGSCQKEHRGTP